MRDIDVIWVKLLSKNHHHLMEYIRWAPQTNSDKSYLIYMAMRALEMHRVLKSTGSIYLHCDPTMSHLLRGLLDCIFGRTNFRNEIIWKRKENVHNLATKQFGRNADIILFYAKSSDALFKKQYQPYDENYIRKNYCYNDNDGRGDYTTMPLTNESGGNASYEFKGIVRAWRWSKEKMEEAYLDNRLRQAKKGSPWRYKKYLSEAQGIPVQTIWTDIPPVSGNESTRYPTQKPLALLRRIISASSNEGDVILDPFCGCATTCVAAAKLRRKWIGIDISPMASILVARRIKSELDAIDENEYGKHIHRTDLPHRTDIGRISAPRTHKDYLYGSQGGYCNGCGEHFEKQHLEVDHRIAKSVGGTDHIENLQLLCSSCNRIKGQRGMEYLMSKLNFDDISLIQTHV